MIVSFAPENDPIVAKLEVTKRPAREHRAHEYDVLTRGRVGGMRRLYEDTRYLLILLSDSESVMFDEKRRCIYELMEYIGNKVGRKAGVVLRAPHEIEENLNTIKNDFPSLYEGHIKSSTPCIFVIEQDYGQFNPDKDNWAVIKLSDLFDEWGRPNAKLSEQFAREFIKVVNSGESVFDFLCRAHIDRNRALFLESFEAKPGIFGFSVDLKKWLKLTMPSAQER
jgi:hypothetical protein